LTAEASALQAALAEPGLYANEEKDRLRDLLARQATIRRETEQMESAWLEASELLEAQMQSTGDEGARSG